jgi:WD40-like Beta Propeller Repeat
MKINLAALVVLFLSFTVAQTRETLLGTWQAQTGGVTIIQTIREDGSYSFDVAAQNYLEEGTWQLDGENFLQQWQDLNTGEAMNVTYRLEFLGENSFTMSGGNLDGTVYTFTRVDTANAAPNPLSASNTSEPNLSLLDKNYLLKFPPPETGEYTCSSSNLSVGTTFDPTGSFGDTMPVYGVDVLPSLVGNLVLNPDGTYKMTKSTGGGGTYSFDAASNQVVFTGEIAAFPIDYVVEDGQFTIRLNFLDEASNKVSSLSCSLASANAVAPTTATPNPGLPGTLTLHLKEGQIVNVVAETAEMQLVGEGMQGFQTANGETIYVSNNGLIEGYPEFTILNPDDATVTRLEINDGGETKEGSSVEDIFSTSYIATPSEPVLSGDGSLIAYSSVDELGTQSVIVRRRVGGQSEVTAQLPEMAQPTWMKDGGLIMAGGASATGSLSSVEGIYLTDASFGTPRRIDPNLANPLAPALSPDGGSVAFILDKQLWLMGVDGGNPRSLTDRTGLEFYGFPAWSPDGQWLAVAAAEPNLEAWSFVLILPTDGDMTKAQRLDAPGLSPIIVNRDSRIAWY